MLTYGAPLFHILEHIIHSNNNKHPYSMKVMTKQLVAMSIAVAGSVSTSMADPFAFNNGDLILGVQATSGVGLAKNLFFNLGSAVSLRNNPNPGALGNIGATLSTTFGANWYSRTDLYFGVIANLTGNNAFNTISAVGGDPAGTFYVSANAATPGQGALISAGTYSQSALNGGATTLNGTEAMIVTLTAEADGSAILTQATQPTEWNTGWSYWNPVPGAAFNIFTGGIQQSFGKTASLTYVDIQRVLPRLTGANPTGVVGGGTYVASIAISSSGAISTVIPTSAFDIWIGAYPSITDPADKLSSADPDEDGATNLEEFGFGGNPTDSSDNGIRLTQSVDANGDNQGDISLTLEVRSGANFTASGNDLVATIDDITYRIEGSTDLSVWDSVVSPVSPDLGSGSPSTGYDFKTFRLNAGNGLTGKGFLRASVVK